MTETMNTPTGHGDTREWDHLHGVLYNLVAAHVPHATPEDVEATADALLSDPRFVVVGLTPPVVEGQYGSVQIGPNVDQGRAVLMKDGSGVHTGLMGHPFWVGIRLFKAKIGPEAALMIARDLLRAVYGGRQMYGERAATPVS
jgi:hypothetical protein